MSTDSIKMNLRPQAQEIDRSNPITSTSSFPRIWSNGQTDRQTDGHVYLESYTRNSTKNYKQQVIN